MLFPATDYDPPIFLSVELQMVRFGDLYSTSNCRVIKKQIKDVLYLYINNKLKSIIDVG